MEYVCCPLEEFWAQNDPSVPQITLPRTHRNALIRRQGFPHTWVYLSWFGPAANGFGFGLIWCRKQFSSFPCGPRVSVQFAPLRLGLVLGWFGVEFGKNPIENLFFLWSGFSQFVKNNSQTLFLQCVFCSSQCCSVFTLPRRAQFRRCLQKIIKKKYSRRLRMLLTSLISFASHLPAVYLVSNRQQAMVPIRLGSWINASTVHWWR